MARTNINDFDREDLAYRVGTIRKALYAGLASFGEIERLQNAAGIYELGGNEVPKELRAIHQTGASDTVIQFADALRFLDELAETA